LIFTGHEYADGGDFIFKALQKEKIKASFFFTGDFYRNNSFKKVITKLKNEKHYLGPHSDKHLLYCDWDKRDSLLVSKKTFQFDLADNYTAMARLNLNVINKNYFLPPYEWYNDSIANWTNEMGLQLINFTPGTRSNADYTIPSEKNYRSSDEIFKSIIEFEKMSPSGLNGFMLLIHIGTSRERTDKFYCKLPLLITVLKDKGYHFQTVKELLKTD